MSFRAKILNECFSKAEEHIPRKLKNIPNEKKLAIVKTKSIILQRKTGVGDGCALSHQGNIMRIETTTRLPRKLKTT